MSIFNFDYLRDLIIGSVDYVSPSEIKVLLDINAPQNTAINTGVPSLFPRINGFVLIPNEIGALVGIINWLGVEHSPYPKRTGLKDYDLIDLPFPLRKMSINPIGTLKLKGKSGDNDYELERGVYSFPSIGDSVVLPTERQLKSIVENRDGNAEVIIGKATLAGNSDVRINPDKLFGRHLAVLGNTGSGKSCSVAGLIRWSLEAAKEYVDKQNESGSEDTRKFLNARVLILDPNGEYSSAFDGIDKPVRRYRVKLENDTDTDSYGSLKVPAWMWNSHEWISFSQAAPGAQRPILLDALIALKSGRQMFSPVLTRLNRFIIAHIRQIELWIGMPPVSMQFIDNLNCGRLLVNLSNDALLYVEKVTASDLTGELNIQEKDSVLDTLRNISSQAMAVSTARSFVRGGNTTYNAFSEVELNLIRTDLCKIVDLIPQTAAALSSNSADTPINFDISDLPPFIDQMADNSGNNLSQFVAMLNLRLRFLIEDERLKEVVNPSTTITLSDWLDEYIGKNKAENGQIAIIDLSLIPSDVIHVIVAVLARLTFEATHRYKRINRKELPSIIVLEEAHTFIKDKAHDETNHTQLCREIFERIAREGRKFGLSIVLSSQRPSELSPTVLSQCNTFLLHRLVNDRDQDLVRKLVPDNIGGLLKELPILPTRKAILLGWAAPIPILVELRELAEKHRPQSNDPRFWDVWVGNEEREIDWKKIALQWQGKRDDEQSETEEFVKMPPPDFFVPSENF